MSVYKSIYWKFPVLVQKYMGVWPYHNSTYDKYMRILVYVAIYALLIPMGIRMFQEIGINNEIAIENLVGQMYLNAGVLKFSSTIIMRKKQKIIYDMIAKDWETTTEEEELKIMKRHAGVGRYISLFYLVTCSSSAVAFFFIPTFYPLLDYIYPEENVTRKLALPLYAEFYIDQQKYLGPLFLSVLISGFFSMTVFVTYDMAFAMCTQHVCSLFDIICHRLDEASNCGNVEGKDFTKVDFEIHRLLTKAVELHQIVIMNVNQLENAYFVTWFFILLLNTTAIGGGLYTVLLKLNKPVDLLRYGMVFTSIFIHKYFIFLPGQKIRNHSLQVFDRCYSCNWYNFSSKCKVILLIIMSRSIRPLQLTGGKMFVLSMETYSSMLKGAGTYFTVFASQRNH